jgi:hypothetical protein
MESAMEGDGSVISTTLHFTAAGGLPAGDSAFATANGCMQVRAVVKIGSEQKQHHGAYSVLRVSSTAYDMIHPCTSLLSLPPAYLPYLNHT